MCLGEVGGGGGGGGGGGEGAILSIPNGAGSNLGLARLQGDS